MCGSISKLSRKTSASERTSETKIPQSLPGELAREAWNTEKLMRAYEARKKLEMMGAMMFSSAKRRQREMVNI